MRSMKLVVRVRFISQKKLFADIPRKCILLNMIRAVILFGKMHFFLISENEFFMKLNVMELQVFMEFMKALKAKTYFLTTWNSLEDCLS